MSEALDVTNMTEEEIQASVDNGDIVLREGYDDEGNEITQYELTDLGESRVMNNVLLGALREVVVAYHRGKSYNKVSSYIKSVLAEVQAPARPTMINLEPVVVEEEEDSAA